MKRLLAFLAAALIASAAHAQNAKFQLGGWPPGNTVPGTMETCYNSLGQAEPQALCDLYPSTVPGTRPAAPTDRAVVVTMSPNSGLPNLLPVGVTPIAAVATGTTSAVTATMPAVAGRTNYICQFDVSALGGTATVGPITLTGLIGGSTLTYQMASTASGNLFTRQFNPCMPASATNTAIAVATTADGTASAVDVNITGFLK